VLAEANLIVIAHCLDAEHRLVTAHHGHLPPVNYIKPTRALPYVSFFSPQWRCRRYSAFECVPFTRARFTGQGFSNTSPVGRFVSAFDVSRSRCVSNLLCDLHYIDSARTGKCDRDTNVVHKLLENEKPKGVPYPMSIHSEQAESVEPNSDASQHRRYDSEMHTNINPLEKVNRSGHI
jgi:hypothetical protein